jgi:hypothetical protein
MRALALLAVLAFPSMVLGAAEGDRVQLDPFARATAGDPACPEQPPPLLTPEDARNEAHVRVERGTRCGMDNTCEPGGTYKRDPELNEKMRAVIAADARFSNTSVWVTTSRKWVTLQGCVRSQSQRRALVKLVHDQPMVERVFDELKVGHAPAAQHPK